jgi:hypothetical protein
MRNFTKEIKAYPATSVADFDVTRMPAVCYSNQNIFKVQSDFNLTGKTFLVEEHRKIL